MMIEEIADEINAHGSSFHLSALGTVEGDKWTCEIIGFKWPEMSSSHICEEFRATPEEAANAAYREWMKIKEDADGDG